MRTVILDPHVIGSGLAHVMIIGSGSDNYLILFELEPFTGLS